jgi:hypothetical protein
MAVAAEMPQHVDGPLLLLLLLLLLTLLQQEILQGRGHAF